MDIGVLGAGSWGTALSLVLSDNKHKIHLWSHNIDSNQKYFKYFSNIEIPKNILLTSNIEQVLEQKIILIALPSHLISKTLDDVKINSESIIVNCSKGFDLKTDKRISSLISESFFNSNLKNMVFLTGPSHAEEVIKKTPTALIAAGDSNKNTKLIQEILSNNYFRVYQNSDIAGAEIGAACKNVISIASGISIGLKYGDNTIAALISRGLQEIIRLGVALGGKKETFYGLSGLGDLSVTAFSKFSRNRQFGEKIGSGLKLDEAIKDIDMVVEGVNATKVIHRISKQHKINMPIVNEVYSILFDDKNPKLAINDLMARELTAEII